MQQGWRKWERRIEYKKAKRDLQRQAIQNGNTKLEKRSKCKETLR
jgi:ribosomal protein S4